MILFFLMFIYQGLKENDKNTRYIKYGYGFFTLGYAITRIFFLFSDYERELNGITPLHLQYVSIAYAIGMFSILVLSLVIEKYLVKFKYIFVISSAISLIFAILSIIAIEIQSITQIIMYITAGIVLIGIIGLYVYMVVKLTGTYRNRAIGALIGFLLIAIGLILDMRFLEDIFGSFDYIRLILSPFLMISGFLIFGITQIKSNK
ncbi:MAG: hypothetical protein ACTSPY_18240 [Candidatus Helarchaeota archaeon]